MKQALGHWQSIFEVLPPLLRDEYLSGRLSPRVFRLLTQRDYLISIRLAVGAARPEPWRTSVLIDKLESNVIPVKQKWYIGVGITQASGAQTEN